MKKEELGTVGIKLINAFALNTIEELEADTSILIKTFLIEDYNVIRASEDYASYYTLIRRMKGNIERVEKYSISEWEQIFGYLDLLRRSYGKYSKDFVIYQELIRTGVYKNWSEEIRNVFDEGNAMISEWNDFFFSYTSKDRAAINNDFKEILIAEFNDDGYENNKKEDNLLAQLIVKYLNQNNLKGFYDRSHIKYGDGIEKVIYEKCRSTFSFIQLIERAVLYEEEENWCHKEYETFSAWADELELNSDDRYFFLVTDNDVYPANEASYRDWISKIKDKFHMKNMDEFSKKKLRNRVDKLAVAVLKLKKEILNYYFRRIEEKIM